MFGWDQKDRLLRESWTADALAQELYAMFGSNVPNDTSAPVNVTLPVGNKVAPYQITGAPPSGPAITINRNDGTTINFNNDGSVTQTPPPTDPGFGFGGGGAGQTTTLSGPGAEGGGGSGGPVIPVWG